MGRRRVGVRRGRLDAEGFWLKCQAISAEWRSIPSLLSARTITIIAWHFCREPMVSHYTQPQALTLKLAAEEKDATGAWMDLDESRPPQTTIRHLLKKNYTKVYMRMLPFMSLHDS